MARPPPVRPAWGTVEPGCTWAARVLPTGKAREAFPAWAGYR